MKVITLKNIVKFIESTHGKQSITRTTIKDETITPGVLFIHDKGTICPEAELDSNDELAFFNYHDRVHCILLETDLCDFNGEEPFIKSREALSGYLVVDDKVPSEEELASYWYTLSNH